MVFRIKSMLLRKLRVCLTEKAQANKSWWKYNSLLLLWQEKQINL